MRGFFGLEHLDRLRRIGSILQGHPIRKTPGVDMTTGSLGHGLSIGLGMALEGRLRGDDSCVYAMLGDGELNEGHVREAAMAAAKYRTDRLIALVDRNRLQMDGCCDDIMPMGDIAAKFRAFGWKTFEINGHDMREILGAVEKARRVRGRPTCIVANTVKGKGVSYREDRFERHGKCPNVEEFACAMKEIWGEDS